MIRTVNERLDWKKYNWQKFEDICFEYMEEKYDTPAYKVKITKRQKDGGRDIVVVETESEYTIWGECKHHKNSVGLSTIGKNVVLAITNHIHKLVFFSVSHVTPNTKYEILKAAKIHNFDVLFLDGIHLDLEISGNKNLLRKYFPESFYLYHPDKDILLADFCVDEFKNAHNSNYNTDNSFTKLENGLIFYIHIFLKNYFPQDITDISISVEESEACHFYNAQNSVKCIKAFCDIEITVKGLLLNTQAIVPIPNINISYCVEGNLQSFLLIVGEIDGTDIWRIPICGAKNLNFLTSEIPKIQNLIRKGYVRILYLKGASGMGKTRMLEEIETKFTEKSGISIYIDAQSYSDNLFFRELVRQLLCLPDLKDTVLPYNEFALLLQKYNIAFSDIELVYNYLWKNRKMETLQIFDFLHQCILNRPIKTQLLIQIDNIQKLNCILQQYLTCLCGCLKDEKVYLCIAFTLNTSIKPNSKCTPLIDFLNQNAMHEENPFVIPFELNELETQDAHYMIQSCLKLSPDYSLEVQQIERKIGRLPLDILLFCKTLYGSEAFSWNGEANIIKNAEKFSKQLNKLSESEQSIIELRIEKLISSQSKISFLKVFQLLTFFENHLPINVLYNFRISFDKIQVLKQNLVIKENYDSTLSFYHDNYFRHFKDRTVYSFNEKEWNLLCQLMTELTASLGAVAQINMVKCLAHLHKIDDFRKYSQVLLDEFCASGNSTAVLSLTQFCLKWLNEQEDRNQWLRFSIEKGFVELEVVSFVQGINTLKYVKSKLDEDSVGLDKQLVGKFYHQYVNVYTHSALYPQAIDALKDYSKVSGLNDEDYFLIEDRYGLVYYSLGDFNKAENHILNALAIAKKMKSNFWTSTAYSDRAFNYLTNTNCKSKMIKYFELASKYYVQGEDTTPFRIIEIQIQSCLSKILANDYEKAEEYINNAINYCKKQSYTYLLIPSYNVKAYLMLLKGEAKEALKYLYQARFSSEVFGETKHLIIIFNTLGIVNSIIGNIKAGKQYFEYAEKIIRHMGTPDNVANRFTPLIINWLYSEFVHDPHKVTHNAYYNYYHTKRIDSIYSSLTQGKSINKKLNRYFPFVIDNYIFMY